MSLSSTTNRVSYVGINSGATYNFPYLFFNDADLVVNFYDTVSGSTYLQVLNTDYTISGTKTNSVYAAGANVVVNSALPTTWDVVIARSPSPVQNFSLGQNGVIPSVPLTQELDYITLLIQREHDLNTRSVRLADGVVATNFDPTLPIGIAFASNCVLVVNSAGTGWTFALNQGGFGPSGLPLIGNGSNAVATYQALNLAGAGVTGTLPASAGGTGATAWTPGQVVVASTAAVLAGLPNGTTGYVLTAQSGSATPAWSPIAIGSGAVSAGNISGVLAIINGGTGNSNFTTYGLVYGNSSALAQVAAGTAGQLLTFNSGAAPSWSSLSGSSYVGLWPLSQGGTGGSNIVITGSSYSGTWPISQGGTGNSNFIQYGLVYGNSSALAEVAVGAQGNVLIFNSGSAPTWSSAVSINGSGLAINKGFQLTLTGSSWPVTIAVASSTSPYNLVLPTQIPSAGAFVTDANGNMTVTNLNSVPSSYILTANSGGVAPSFQAFSVSGQSGILAIVNGGTGVGNITTASSGLIPLWQGANPMAALSPIAMENMLVNGGFDWWQALPTGSNVLLNNVSYVADQWYISNSGGVTVNVSKPTGQLPGSLFGHQILVTTASGAQASYELWQSLDNQTTMTRFVGQSSISAALNIKALGFVNQIGVQLFSASGEVRCSLNTGLSGQSSITSEQTFTVTSNAWTSSGPLLFSPTYAAGSNGIVAMRIRVTATNSGTFSVGSNGFIVEQVGLYGGIGNTNQWQRRGKTPQGELWDCLRFYEKSYDPLTAPGAIANAGILNAQLGLINQTVPLNYKTTKRTTPTLSFYSNNTGAVGKWFDNTSSGDTTCLQANPGLNCATASPAGSSGHNMSGHYIVDSRM